MQRIWLEPGRNPGHPDWGEDHPFHRHVAGQTIPNQRGLLDAARGAGVEVIHTIIRSLPPDGRDRSLYHKLTPLPVPHADPLGDPVPAPAPHCDHYVLPQSNPARHRYRVDGDSQYMVTSEAHN